LAWRLGTSILDPVFASDRPSEWQRLPAASDPVIASSYKHSTCENAIDSLNLRICRFGHEVLIRRVGTGAVPKGLDVQQAAVTARR
jgi:hypothetical protein